MTVTLVDIQNPQALFDLFHTFEGPVLSCGIDLRRNQSVEHLICAMTASGRQIPQLELNVSHNKDISRLLRYMKEGFAA